MSDAAVNFRPIAVRRLAAIALTAIVGSAYAAISQAAPLPTTDMAKPLLSDSGVPIRDFLAAPESDVRCEKPLDTPGACPTLTLGRYLATALTMNFCPPPPAAPPPSWCDDMERHLSDDQRMSRMDRAQTLRVAAATTLTPEEVTLLKRLSNKLAAANLFPSVLNQVVRAIDPTWEPVKLK